MSNRKHDPTPEEIREQALEIREANLAAMVERSPEPDVPRTTRNVSVYFDTYDFMLLDRYAASRRMSKQELIRKWIEPQMEGLRK